VNHYCTYFDSGFLIQGLTLSQSLLQHDFSATLWILSLNDEAGDILRSIGDPRLRIVSLSELEQWDSNLTATKPRRTTIEYYFTLTPCWPRWLLKRHPEIDRVMYVDADTFFFATPRRIWEAFDRSMASVLITAHRFPPFLRRLEIWGRYNVGVQVFRNDARGMAVLEDWRERCLEWCHDILDVKSGRFADQKYLDAWPEQFGSLVHVLDDPGVNLAPWNWAGHAMEVTGSGVTIDGVPLTLYHFAKFRPVSARLWDSGQSDYGPMPRCLRNAIYGPYAQALEAVRSGPVLRERHGYRHLPLRKLRRRGARIAAWVVLGSLWFRTRNGVWMALGFPPLGRWLRRRQGLSERLITS